MYKTCDFYTVFKHSMFLKFIPFFDLFFFFFAQQERLLLIEYSKAVKFVSLDLLVLSPVLFVFNET